MKAIIPAAGFGSRLRPHTFTTPKSMLPVAGRPMIAYIIDQVIEWGATEITMVVGHLRSILENYLTENYDIPFEFREQDKMLGLGHAVLTGLNKEDGEVIIILGDTIIETDLKPVIGRGVTSIGVKSVEDARKFGVVELDRDQVVRLTEKSPEPPTNLAIVGVYYVRNGGVLARAVNEIIERGITVKNEYQLTDALQVMIDWGERIETFPVVGWFDCGKPTALLETNAYLLKKHGGEVPPSGIETSVIIPPVSIGAGAVLSHSVIGPDVSIGKRCHITNSVISNTICADDVSIEHSLLSGSLIGSRARITSRQVEINIGASSEIEL